MSGAFIQPKTAFLWRAALILFPVAILTVIACTSVRQDRILAEHDARERAGEIAGDLAQKLFADLNDPARRATSRFTFVLGSDGNIVSPPTWNPVPVPRTFDRGALTPSQSALWSQIEHLPAPDGSISNFVKLSDDFILSRPPTDLAASATFNEALALRRSGNNAGARKCFELIVLKYPDAIGESGLSLSVLARFELAEMNFHSGPDEVARAKISVGQNRSVNRIAPDFPTVPVDRFVMLQSLCSNLVTRPVALTPYFLKRLLDDADSTSRDTVLKWERIWADEEVERELARAALASRSSNPAAISGLAADPAKNGFTGRSQRMFWFRTPNPLLVQVPGAFPEIHREQSWLAVCQEQSATERRFYCFGEAELGALATRLAQTEPLMPDYFGAGFELAGRKLIEFAPDLHLWNLRYKGGGKSSEREVKEVSDVLATNLFGRGETTWPDGNAISAMVYLTSPDKLYQRQNARRFWFGLLVAVSAAVALVGLGSLRSAFHWQRLLNEQKSNFVSSVSHELRAPIASMRLLAESLERGKIPDAGKQKEYFAFIVQECRRLSALVENVLDFSRIEQGRKQYELEPTDVRALMEQTVRLMEPYAAEKGVLLKLETPNIEEGPRHPMSGRTSNLELNVDGKAIQQALVNLIDNAIKHSAKGQTVVVGLESGSTIDGQPSTINLFVEDAGPGIPADEHEKIFERFYRRGSELRRETQGVGIGLSIVKHIVEAHGGRVVVRSAPGAGSRFTIEIPF
jgi:signal transduction histidine kinase